MGALRNEKYLKENPQVVCAIIIGLSMIIAAGTIAQAIIDLFANFRIARRKGKRYT
jgi:hypothetical protein